MGPRYLGRRDKESKEQSEQRKKDIQRMKQVWQQTNQLKNLKQNLAAEENMVINEDKLDKALKIAQK